MQMSKKACVAEVLEGDNHVMFEPLEAAPQAQRRYDKPVEAYLSCLSPFLFFIAL